MGYKTLWSHYCRTCICVISQYCFGRLLGDFSNPTFLNCCILKLADYLLLKSSRHLCFRCFERLERSIRNDFCLAFLAFADILKDFQEYLGGIFCIYFALECCLECIIFCGWKECLKILFFLASICPRINFA